MRTIHVTGPLVSVEMLSRACAEASASRAPGTPVEDEVFVLVNGLDLGRVPVDVWSIVQERIETILGPEVTIAESPRRWTRSTQRAPASGTRPLPLRVLVAEHVPSFRAGLLAALSAAGLEALGVADGLQAQRQLASHPPDVLVADFELPRLAGDELIARARAAHGRELRVAALIGAELPQLLVPEHDAADLVLGQPFDPGVVVAHVRAALDRHKNVRAFRR